MIKHANNRCGDIKYGNIKYLVYFFIEICCVEYENLEIWQIKF